MTFRLIATIGAAACLIFAAEPAFADLVVNGGFETENLDSNNAPIPPPPGWSISGDGISIDSTQPNSGIYDIAFGTFPGDSGTLSQAIATTPAPAYNLRFALLNEELSASDTFTVTFGSFSNTIIGDTGLTYTNESFVVPGTAITGGSTTLSFIGINEGADWNLDDVSVTAAAVPEPSTVYLFGFALAGVFAALSWARRSFARP